MKFKLENPYKKEKVKSNIVEERIPKRSKRKQKNLPISKKEINKSDDFYEKETPIYQNELSFFKEETKCKRCSRPFSRNIDETWRDYCVYCFMKNNGFISTCSECPKKIIKSFNPNYTQNVCQKCYVRKNGIKGNCKKTDCKNKVYYRMRDSLNLKDFCEDCFLKENGVKKRCLDCKIEFLVFKSQESWRNRCYDCWIVL